MKSIKIKFTIFLIFPVLLSLGFLFSPKVFAQELININAATLEELDSLPGIGPSKAQAIIDYRNQNGDFETIEDLMNVSGIGQATFDNLKNLITVGQDDSKQGTGTNFDVVINELLPNPEGSDDAEWIELKNLGSSSINLTDWQICDATSKLFYLSGTIPANGFFIIEKSVSGISLNNSGGEEVRLFDNLNNLISQTSYTESAGENSSWARDNLGNYFWSIPPTKNSENMGVEEQKTDEPVDIISETPLTKDNLSIYKNKIIINEVLIDPLGVDDGFNEWIELQNISTDEIFIWDWKLKDNQNEYLLHKKLIPGEFWVLRRAETGLSLNNLAGDKIELIDAQEKMVANLSYKKSYENKSYNWCKEENKWLWLEETSLGKENNCPFENADPVAYFEVSAEQIRIGQVLILNAEESYDPDGEIIKYIWEFEKEVEIINPAVSPEENTPLLKGETGLVFTSLSPMLEIRILESGQQQINLKIVDNLEAYDTYSQKINFSDTEKNNSPQIAEGAQTVAGISYSLINLDEIRTLAKGSLVTVEGQVAVEPGVLGANIFYLTEPSNYEGSGQGGIQVYSYNKDFPTLVLGDRIMVSGEISEAYSETRIKIDNQFDVYVVESDNPPEAQDTNLNAVDEKLEGALIKISGEITNLQASDFWVDDDQAELKVSIKPTTGINLENLEIGHQVEVTGILSATDSSYRLLPRYKSDIIIGEVLGQEKTEEVPKQKNSLLKYLLALVIALIIIFVILIFKERKKPSL